MNLYERLETFFGKIKEKVLKLNRVMLGVCNINKKDKTLPFVNKVVLEMNRARFKLCISTYFIVPNFITNVWALYDLIYRKQ